VYGPWFYLEVIPESGASVSLSRKEAKHAFGSRRMRAGDGVVLFDGCGTRAQGTLGEELAVDGSLLIGVEASERVPVDKKDVELAASLPKGDRLSTMLDMATQAGMNSFRPLECERSVVKASAMRADRTHRWVRIMLEACKQSERVHLPTLSRELSPQRTIEEAKRRGRTVLVAQQGGEPVHTSASQIDGPITVLVGPEGGFSESELRAFDDADVEMISLGGSICRIETAAVIAVAAIKNTAI
jgi:16S rRNA (uracil1498-N3)-methyltransferase